MAVYSVIERGAAIIADDVLNYLNTELKERRTEVVVIVGKEFF